MPLELMRMPFTMSLRGRRTERVCSAGGESKWMRWEGAGAQAAHAPLAAHHGCRLMSASLDRPHHRPFFWLAPAVVDVNGCLPG